MKTVYIALCLVVLMISCVVLFVWALATSSELAECRERNDAIRTMAVQSDAANAAYMMWSLHDCSLPADERDKLFSDYGFGTN